MFTAVEFFGVFGHKLPRKDAVPFARSEIDSDERFTAVSVNLQERGKCV